MRPELGRAFSALESDFHLTSTWGVPPPIAVRAFGLYPNVC